MSSRLGYLFFVALLSFSWETVAVAQSDAKTLEDPMLLQAQQAMDEAEYERALQWIEKGLLREGLSTHFLLQLYWNQGVCYISIGNQNSASTSFRKLLAIAPAYEPDPATPPKIMRAFQAAKETPNIEPDRPVRLQPRTVPLGPQAPAQDTTVRLIVDGPNNETIIKRVVLYVRSQGESAYSNIDAVPTDANKETFAANVPALWLKSEPNDYRMEFYWEILGRDGVILAQAGTSRAPNTFTVLAGVPASQSPSASPAVNDESTSNASTIYIAIGISAAIVAGVVTAIYLLQPKTASATVSVECEGQTCFQ